MFVGIVVDYVDATRTTRTPMESFGGLKLTIKEQTSEKVLGCVFISNSNGKL